MAVREKELADLRADGDGHSDGHKGILDRFIGPFRRGVPPPSTPSTGFYTDTTVCIGCKACEVACKQWNQLPADGFAWTGMSYDNTAELSATSWRHVKFIEQFAPRPGAQPAPTSGSRLPDGTPEQRDTRTPLDLIADSPLSPREKGGGEGELSDNRLTTDNHWEIRWLMMSDVCKHCVRAPCQQACPTGAILHNEFENVYIQPDICNGCAYCIAACPFGVITRAHFDGHAHKCTLCYDRQKDGLVPACAKACPTGSIQFGPLEELRRRARSRVEELKRRGVPSAYLYGETPTATYSALNSFYLLVDHPTVYGLPDEPFNPWLHMAGDYARSLVGALTAMAILVAVFLILGR
jgi:formate dehydrogenase iron-sulfur subunit